MGNSEPGLFPKVVLAKDPWGKFQTFNFKNAFMINRYFDTNATYGWGWYYDTDTAGWFILLDEPGKPGNAEVIDWDADHADIKWTKPEKDGGSPIISYVIEYKVSISFFPVFAFALETPVWHHSFYFC